MNVYSTLISLFLSRAYAIPKMLPIAEIPGPNGNRILTLNDLYYAYGIGGVIAIGMLVQIGRWLFDMFMRKGEKLDQRVEHIEGQIDGMMDILRRIDERTKFYERTSVSKDDIHSLVKEELEYALRLRER